MAVDAGMAVRVEGLADFRRDLKEADRNLPKVITAANVTIARTVRDAAAGGLRTKSGATPPSKLSAGGTQRYGYVQLSGATAFGDEFGGGKYGAGHPKPPALKGHTTQFRQYRPGPKGG